MPAPLVIASLGGLARTLAANPTIRKSGYDVLSKWTGKHLAGGMGGKPVQGLMALTAADAAKGFVQEAGEDAVNYAAGTNVDLPEITPGSMLGAQIEELLKQKIKAKEGK